MFQPFRHDNTEGYSRAQREKLNAEFEKRFKSGEWEHMEPEEAAKEFCDEVARR